MEVELVGWRKGEVKGNFRFLRVYEISGASKTEEEQVGRKGVPFTFKHKYMEFIEAVRANDVAKENIEEKGNRKREPKLF